jgi:hypothetical protein
LAQGSHFRLAPAHDNRRLRALFKYLNLISKALVLGNQASVEGRRFAAEGAFCDGKIKKPLSQAHPHPRPENKGKIYLQFFQKIKII